MITGVNHLSFTVSDVEKSAEFYKDVLGLKLMDICERDKDFSEKVTGIKTARLKIAYLEAVNCSLELVQYLCPPAQKIDTRTCNVGSAHICFNVSDFHQKLGRLREDGVHFAGSPCVIPAGPNKGKMVLYFEDPDSNTIEIISNERLVQPLGVFQAEQGKVM